MIEHPLPVGRRLALLDQFLSTAQSSTRIVSGVVCPKIGDTLRRNWPNARVIS